MQLIFEVAEYQRAEMLVYYIENLKSSSLKFNNANLEELEKLNNSYLLNPQCDNGEFYGWLVDLDEGKLKELNYKQNQYKLPYMNLADIMQSIDSEEKTELLPKLLYAKDDKGRERFNNKDYIVQIYKTLDSKEKFGYIGCFVER